jgi:hypothetical protein
MTMSFDIASTPVGTRTLDELVGTGFADELSIADLSEAELYEFVTRAAVEVSSEKWTAFPGRSSPWEAHVSPPAIERLAREVATSPAARWWSGSVDARPQVWIGRAFSAPTEGLRSRGLASKPPAAIWTSSAVAGLPSAWWSVLKDGADSAPPEEPQAIWQLTAHPDAVVYEIRTPDDYRWLCEAYTGPTVGGWITPDWEAATELFDGIHLTVEGLIRCQGVEVQTEYGPTKLDNWDSEATAWLRWTVSDLERLGTISRTTHTSSATRGRAFPRALRRS